MTGLERRLGRLETMTGIGIVHPTIFVSFVGLGDLDRHRPLVSATINGRIYHRAEGEAEDAFCSRAVDADKAEGWTPKNCGRLVILQND